MRLATRLLTGGRRRWAHPAFTRMNIDPIILRNQLEDVLQSLRSSVGSGENMPPAPSTSVSEGS